MHPYDLHHSQEIGNLGEKERKIQANSKSGRHSRQEYLLLKFEMSFPSKLSHMLERTASIISYELL